MTRTQVLQEEIRWMRFEEACGGWQSRRRHRRRFVCWRGKRTFRFDRLAEEVEPNEPRLPPRHLDDGTEGVRRDLESLGVFQPLYDGRLNIPSVFRVGYGLGLRGGVKPVR